MVVVEAIVMMQANGRKSRPPRGCGLVTGRIQWDYVCSVCYFVVRDVFSYGPCVIMLERFRERPFAPD